MSPTGWSRRGRLHQEFERLKAALKARALDNARKRPLLRFLAGWDRDFGASGGTQTCFGSCGRPDPGDHARRRESKAPVRPTIAAALDLLNRASDVEVILCGRGGSSIEDLWAFNEEVVAGPLLARIP